MLIAIIVLAWVIPEFSGQGACMQAKEVSGSDGWQVGARTRRRAACVCSSCARCGKRLARACAAPGQRVRSARAYMRRAWLRARGAHRRRAQAVEIGRPLAVHPWRAELFGYPFQVHLGGIHCGGVSHRAATGRVWGS